MLVSYGNLCTEFYELAKPAPGPLEWAFYENLVRNTPGQCLEAMCGSGRLLIPLFEKGYHVEGVDLSESMLKCCEEKCISRSLLIPLYQQALNKLALPRQYDLIFIALGSFQHIKDPEEALSSLHQLRKHLKPGGVLLLEMTSQAMHLTRPLKFEQEVTSANGYKIVNKSKAQQKEKDLIINRMRYEKWEGGKLQDAEEDHWYIRFYPENQMVQMLDQAGFHTVQKVNKSFELNQKALIYFATA